MNIIIVILIICIILYSVWSSYYTYDENIYVKSDIDNKEYLIRRGKGKSELFLKNSANTLAEINRRIMVLIDTMDKKSKGDVSSFYFVKFLKNNYNFNKISEAAYDTRYTTYTVNKDEMHICLRTRDFNEKLYDINLLMYVILHELAHMCNYDNLGNPIQGHGDEFKYIFHSIVQEAINSNLYTFVDYKKSPVEYCGLTLNSTIM